ncbi:MAG TPA: sensor histidine kinase [Opitutaceae bacterium]|nr:sensor histidine kinase [Opitutaceae bacterium]HRE06930.1 sensor histidine kinase [Opitutaceae bacterium]
MSVPLNPRSVWLRLAGIGAFWTLVGLAFASQFYLSSSLLGRTVSWVEAISYSLGDWYVWALLSAPIVWLARRFPPESPRRLRTVAVHLVAALLCAWLYVVLRSLVGVLHAQILDEPVSFSEVFQPLLVKTYPFNLLVYGVILSASHAIGYYRKYHERTVHALELEKHLTEARLQSLLRQLKPHFLFNTLNGIASLMHRDVDAADRMLVRLSELLRITMHHPGRALTSLRDEFAFIEKYLEIERIRFRDRLSVTIEVSPEVLDCDVPSLILQPLVENAIRHGIEPQPSAGRLVLQAHRTANDLVLVVRDNGPGFPLTGPAREGIGLANTRARLTELYGARHHFTLTNHPDGGLEARIVLPA